MKPRVEVWGRRLSDGQKVKLGELLTYKPLETPAMFVEMEMELPRDTYAVNWVGAYDYEFLFVRPAKTKTEALLSTIANDPEVFAKVSVTKTFLLHRGGVGVAVRDVIGAEGFSEYRGELP